MVGEVRFELTSSRSQGECLKPLGYPPTSLVLPRRIELRSPAFQTGVITRPTQAAVHGGPRGALLPLPLGCKPSALLNELEARIVGAG